jgi:hypothetical protein
MRGPASEIGDDIVNPARWKVALPDAFSEARSEAKRFCCLESAGETIFLETRRT